MLCSVDLVGAEQEQDLELAPGGGLQHAGHIQAALGRQQAEVEAADPGRRGVQHVEAVPAVLDHAEALGDLARGRKERSAVREPERALAQDQHRPLGLRQAGREIVAAIGEPGQGLRPGAELHTG